MCFRAAQLENQRFDESEMNPAMCEQTGPVNHRYTFHASMLVALKFISNTIALLTFHCDDR
jgi:hypothetical protein